MGRKMAEVKWAEDAEALYAQYRAERDVERRKRLQVLWLVRQGVGLGEAARQAGVGERSVARWLGWYRSGGVGEVLKRLPGHAAPGSASWLTQAQRDELVRRCAAGEFRSSGQVRDWVASRWGIEYKESGIQSMLIRLKIHPKVPRPQAAKADAAAQEGWKKGGSQMS